MMTTLKCCFVDMQRPSTSIVMLFHVTAHDNVEIGHRTLQRGCCPWTCSSSLAVVIFRVDRFSYSKLCWRLKTNVVWPADHGCMLGWLVDYHNGACMRLQWLRQCTIPVHSTDDKTSLSLTKYPPKKPKLPRTTSATQAQPGCELDHNKSLKVRQAREWIQTFSLLWWAIRWCDMAVLFMERRRWRLRRRRR